MLLQFCGLTAADIPAIAEVNPEKYGCVTPGSHIPIVKEETIKRTKPDYIIIFPWNIKDEITKQLHYIKEWNGKFVVFIPNLNIF